VGSGRSRLGQVWCRQVWSGVVWNGTARQAKDRRGLVWSGLERQAEAMQVQVRLGRFWL